MNMKKMTCATIVLAFLSVPSGFSEEAIGGEMIHIKARLYWSDKGPDAGLISAPSVVVKEGAVAKFEDVVEIFTPSKYDPPRIPKSMLGKTTGGSVIGGPKAPKLPTHAAEGSVLPPFPKNFEQQKIGLSLEFRPIIRTDGSVEVQCDLNQVALRGFVNHGTPITIEKPSGLLEKNTRTIEVQENRQLKPEFLKRSKSVSFTKDNFSKPVKFQAVTASAKASAPDPDFAAELAQSTLPSLTLELNAERLPQLKAIKLPEFAKGVPLQIHLSMKTIAFNYETSIPAEIANIENAFFTDAEYQSVIRKLGSIKGVDLMSSPSIVTRSGQLANVEVIREFVYPIEFDPAETMKSPSSGAFPVTPIRPKKFATAEIGYVFDLKPRLLEDGSIEIEVSPKLSEFLGFLNFGAPITAQAKGAFGKSKAVVLTENKLETPTFSRQGISTTFRMPSAMTAMIGGLVSDEEQVIEDKIPFLGDLPVIGKIGRKTKTVEIKQAVYFFITAELINSAGMPVANP